jgi:hypothetical protein
MAMLNNQRVINIYPGHITLTADSLSCSIKGRHFRRCQEHGFQPDLAGGSSDEVKTWMSNMKVYPLVNIQKAMENFAHIYIYWFLALIILKI